MAYKKIEMRYNANIKTKNDVFKTIRFYNFAFKKPYFICNFNSSKNSKKAPAPLSHRNDGPYRYG